MSKKKAQQGSDHRGVLAAAAGLPGADVPSDIVGMTFSPRLGHELIAFKTADVSHIEHAPGLFSGLGGIDSMLAQANDAADITYVARFDPDSQELIPVDELGNNDAARAAIQAARSRVFSHDSPRDNTGVHQFNIYQTNRGELAVRAAELPEQFRAFPHITYISLQDDKGSILGDPVRRPIKVTGNDSDVLKGSMIQARVYHVPGAGDEAPEFKQLVEIDSPARALLGISWSLYAMQHKGERPLDLDLLIRSLPDNVAQQVGMAWDQYHEVDDLLLFGGADGKELARDPSLQFRIKRTHAFYDGGQIEDTDTSHAVPLFMQEDYILFARLLTAIAIHPTELEKEGAEKSQGYSLEHLLVSGYVLSQLGHTSAADRLYTSFEEGMAIALRELIVTQRQAWRTSSPLEQRETTFAGTYLRNIKQVTALVTELSAHPNYQQMMSDATTKAEHDGRMGIFRDLVDLAKIIGGSDGVQTVSGERNNLVSYAPMVQRNNGFFVLVDNEGNQFRLDPNQYSAQGQGVAKLYDAYSRDDHGLDVVEVLPHNGDEWLDVSKMAEQSVCAISENGSGRTVKPIDGNSFVTPFRALDDLLEWFTQETAQLGKYPLGMLSTILDIQYKLVAVSSVVDDDFQAKAGVISEIDELRRDLSSYLDEHDGETPDAPTQVQNVEQGLYDRALRIQTRILGDTSNKAVVEIMPSAREAAQETYSVIESIMNDHIASASLASPSISGKLQTLDARVGSMYEAQLQSDQSRLVRVLHLLRFSVGKLRKMDIYGTSKVEDALSELNGQLGVTRGLKIGINAHHPDSEALASRYGLEVMDESYDNVGF